MKLLGRFLEDMKSISRIIVALDYPEIDFFKIMHKLRGKVAGIKIGLPCLLTWGAKSVSDAIQSFRQDFFFIADTKMADVGHVMAMTLEKLVEIGFDAVIAHGFVGAKNALDILAKKAQELDVKVFLVAAMSHLGAEEFINKVFSRMVTLASELNFYGLVLPATMPQYIQKARKDLRYQGIIISPGIGAQGASPGDALKAGADFEIIGRMIIKAEDPVEVVSKINKIQKNVLGDKLESCRTSNKTI